MVLGEPTGGKMKKQTIFGGYIGGPGGNLLGSFGLLLDRFGSVFYQRLAMHVYGRRFGSKMRVSGGGECVFSV